MGSANRLSSEIAEFEKRLCQVGEALRWCKHWGIAGFPEAVYTMLFGETLRSRGWTIEYEPSYRGRIQREDFTRGDLRAEHQGRVVWVEARWWWKEEEITPVLSSLAAKLERLDPTVDVVALVLTVGAKLESKERATIPQGWRWSSNDPKGEMNRALTTDLAERWDFLGCAVAESNFDVGTDEAPVPAAGQVAAAFYGLHR